MIMITIKQVLHTTSEEIYRKKIYRKSKNLQQKKQLMVSNLINWWYRLISIFTMQCFHS